MADEADVLWVDLYAGAVHCSDGATGEIEMYLDEEAQETEDPELAFMASVKFPDGRYMLVTLQDGKPLSMN